MPLLGAAHLWQQFVRDDLLLLILPAAEPLHALRTHRGPALILSSDPSALEAAVLLATGGHGYLPTSTPRTELVAAVDTILGGGLALSVHGAAGLYAVLGLIAGNEAVRAAAALTARGMPWARAQRACGLGPPDPTRALEDARHPPERPGRA